MDDFPKLIEQMSHKGLAKNILENVVDFASLNKKLLMIVHTATCIFKNVGASVKKDDKLPLKDKNTNIHETVPLLVQNCLDLLLPCLLWDPSINMDQLYNFVHLEQLLIIGLIKSKNEKIRRSIEQTFKVLCNYIEEKNAKLEGHKEDKMSSLIGEPCKASLLTEANPKLFILQILLKNLPQSKSKGRLRNMENEYFEEYFNLISSLIKLCQSSFSLEGFEIDDNSSSIRNVFDAASKQFDAPKILAFSIDIVRFHHQVLSQQSAGSEKKLSGSKQSSAERLLSGYLLLCQSVLEVIPELKNTATNEHDLINVITQFILDTSQAQNGSLAN